MRNLIAEHLGEQLSYVTDDKHLINDLGADSLDYIELAIEAEVTFSIEITDEELEVIQTVGDFVRLVEGKV